MLFSLLTVILYILSLIITNNSSSHDGIRKKKLAEPLCHFAMENMTMKKSEGRMNKKQMKIRNKAKSKPKESKKRIEKETTV